MTTTAAMILGIAMALTVAPGSGAELPDPTRPYAFAVAIEADQDVGTEGVQWRLSGIRFREGERTAILNGHVVKAGDSLGGARVVEINPADLVLEQNSQKVVVRLVLSGVKKLRDVAQEGSAEE